MPPLPWPNNIQEFVCGKKQSRRGSVKEFAKREQCRWSGGRQQQQQAGWGGWEQQSSLQFSAFPHIFSPAHPDFLQIVLEIFVFPTVLSVLFFKKMGVFFRSFLFTCQKDGIGSDARSRIAYRVATQAGKTHLITSLKSKLTNLCSKLTNWTHLTTNLSICKLTNCFQRSFTEGRFRDILWSKPLVFAFIEVWFPHLQMDVAPCPWCYI